MQKNGSWGHTDEQTHLSSIEAGAGTEIWGVAGVNVDVGPSGLGQDPALGGVLVAGGVALSTEPGQQVVAWTEDRVSDGMVYLGADREDADELKGTTLALAGMVAMPPAASGAAKGVSAAVRGTKQLVTTATKGLPATTTEYLLAQRYGPGGSVVAEAPVASGTSKPSAPNGARSAAPGKQPAPQSNVSGSGTNVKAPKNYPDKGKNSYRSDPNKKPASNRQTGSSSQAGSNKGALHQSTAQKPVVQKLTAQRTGPQSSSAKKLGRSGKQKRLRELMNDDKIGRADRGWLRNDARHIQFGNKKNLRLPRNGRKSAGKKSLDKGYELAHASNKPASKGYDYSDSKLKNYADHKVETKIHKHKYKNNGD